MVRVAEYFDMFGIIIAVALAAWNYFVNSLSMEAAFLVGAGFLWVWQMVFTGITTVFILLMLLGLTGGLTAAGGVASRSIFGGLAGFAMGGLLAVLLFAGFVITRGMLLGGTWLLMHSGTADMTFAEFDQTKLIGGGVLLVLGVLLSGFSTKFSSSSTETTTYSRRYS